MFNLCTVFDLLVVPEIIFRGSRRIMAPSTQSSHLFDLPAGDAFLVPASQLPRHQPPKFEHAGPMWGLGGWQVQGMLKVCDRMCHKDPTKQSPLVCSATGQIWVLVKKVNVPYEGASLQLKTLLLNVEDLVSSVRSF